MYTATNYLTNNINVILLQAPEFEQFEKQKAPQYPLYYKILFGASLSSYNLVSGIPYFNSTAIPAT